LQQVVLRLSRVLQARLITPIALALDDGLDMLLNQPFQFGRKSDGSFLNVNSRRLIADRFVSDTDFTD